MASDDNQSAYSASVTKHLAIYEERVKKLQAHGSGLSRMLEEMQDVIFGLKADLAALDHENQHPEQEPEKKEPQAQVEQQDVSNTAIEREALRLKEVVGASLNQLRTHTLRVVLESFHIG